MSELIVHDAPDAGRTLHPNRVSIWPVEGSGFGIDFTYHGATGYTDAETAERQLAVGDCDELPPGAGWRVDGPVRPASA